MIIPSDNNNTCEQKLNEILNPFRTPFWINEHRWFVRCQVLLVHFTLYFE